MTFSDSAESLCLGWTVKQEQCSQGDTLPRQARLWGVTTATWITTVTVLATNERPHIDNYSLKESSPFNHGYETTPAKRESQVKVSSLQHGAAHPHHGSLPTKLHFQTCCKESSNEARGMTESGQQLRPRVPGEHSGARRGWPSVGQCEGSSGCRSRSSSARTSMRSRLKKCRYHEDLLQNSRFLAIHCRGRPPLLTCARAEWMVALGEAQHGGMERILHACHSSTHGGGKPGSHGTLSSSLREGTGTQHPDPWPLATMPEAVYLHSFQISISHTFKEKWYQEKPLSSTTKFSAFGRQSFPLCSQRQECGLLF